ncbi:O-antigen ligase family protein [Alginatibacterium sediminis]|nr:O-antigen ligase family protein [Alginatibacterium sediminis]
MNINKSNYKPFLEVLFVAIPFIWLATGFQWDGDGEMRLLIALIPILIWSLLGNRAKNEFKEFLADRWLQLIACLIVLVSISYLTYGHSSRELRGLVAVFLLLILTPRTFFNTNNYSWFILFYAISSCALTYYFTTIEVTNRGAWPVNAVPFATNIGLCIIMTSSVVYKYKLTVEQKFRCITAIIALIIALINSQSRGPILALSFVSVVFVLYIVITNTSALKYKAIIVLSFITVVAVIVQVPSINNRIGATLSEVKSIQDGNFKGSIGIRLSMYKTGYQIFKQAPIIGIGKDGIDRTLDQMLSESLISPSVHRYARMTLHNGYLDYLVRNGVVGLIVFLMVLISPLAIIKNNGNKDIGAVLALCTFLAVCNVSDFPFINAQCVVMYFLLIGFCLLTFVQNKTE